MADEQKVEKKVVEKLSNRTKDEIFNAFLCGLIRDVLDGKKNMQQAEMMVREEVQDSLTKDELRIWKEQSQPLARKLMAVAEGFSQAITVMGSRQWGE